MSNAGQNNVLLLGNPSGGWTEVGGMSAVMSSTSSMHTAIGDVNLDGGASPSLVLCELVC